DGQVWGGSTAAARAPLRQGCGGAAGFSSWHRLLTSAVLLGMNQAGNLGSVSRTGADLIRTAGFRPRLSYGGAGFPLSPFWTHEDPACMHGEETGTHEVMRDRHFNSCVDELFIHIRLVPHHTPPRPGCFGAPPPPTRPLRGSLVKGGDYRRGEADS
ncbi:hypothetical protein M9458_009267, partial [Cirrhinus mrigala]